MEDEIKRLIATLTKRAAEYYERANELAYDPKNESESSCVCGKGLAFEHVAEMLQIIVEGSAIVADDNGLDAEGMNDE